MESGSKSPEQQSGPDVVRGVKILSAMNLGTSWFSNPISNFHGEETRFTPFRTTETSHFPKPPLQPPSESPAADVESSSWLSRVFFPSHDELWGWICKRMPSTPWGIRRWAFRSPVYRWLIFDCLTGGGSGGGLLDVGTRSSCGVSWEDFFLNHGSFKHYMWFDKSTNKIFFGIGDSWIIHQTKNLLMAENPWLGCGVSFGQETPQFEGPGVFVSLDTAACSHIATVATL